MVEIQDLGLKVWVRNLFQEPLGVLNIPVQSRV